MTGAFEERLETLESRAMGYFPDDLKGRVVLALMMREDDPGWLPMHRIDDALPDVNGRKLYRMVGSLGIESVKIEFEGVNIPCYPPLTTSVLKEEIYFQGMYRELPSRMTISELAESIGRSWDWTQGRLGLLGIEHTGTEDRIGIPSKMFKKGTLKILRAESLSLPYDGEWMNIHQIAEATDEDYEWVQSILNRIGLDGEPRRSSLTGKTLISYPAYAAKHLRQIRQDLKPAPSGSLTGNAVYLYVDRSENWARKRLSEYTDLAKVYLDSQGVERLHYPPAVVRAIKQESDELRELGEVDTSGYLLFTELARQSGRSKAWVRKQLELIEVETLVGLDGKSRAKTFYSQDVLAVLRKPF